MNGMSNGLIRSFTYYFRRILKFYDIKVQGVPQVLFVMLLVVSFGFRLFIHPILIDLSIYQQQFVMTYQDILSSGSMSDPSVIDELMKIPFSDQYIQLVSVSLKFIGYLLIQQILLMLLTFFYLGAFLVDLQVEKPTPMQYFKKFLKALPRYIGFNILFYLGVGILFVLMLIFASVMMLILPLAAGIVYLISILWFLIQVIFVFRDVTLLDTGVSVFKNFGLAWKLSAGNRRVIGWNIIFIEFLGAMIIMFGTGTHVRLSMFVVSFLEVIVLLIRQRLIALMYMSRTRIESKEAAQD